MTVLPVVFFTAAFLTGALFVAFDGAARTAVQPSAPRARFAAAAAVAAAPVLHFPALYRKATSENHPSGTESTWAGRRFQWNFPVAFWFVADSG